MRILPRAFTRLTRSPGRTAMLVTVLGIGIGATGAIFSVANGLLFRYPPGLHEPSSLYQLSHHSTDGQMIDLFSRAQYDQIGTRRDVFEDVMAFTRRHAAIKVGGRTIRKSTAVITSNYFAVLGVVPISGRSFAEREGVPGAAHVAIVSTRFARLLQEQDKDLLGASLDVNGVVTTVVGVAPGRFGGTTFDPIDVWLPMGMLSDIARRAELRGTADSGFNEHEPELMLVGRLADAASTARTVTVRDETDELTVFLRPVSGLEPDDYVEAGTLVASLLFAVAALLMIATLNVGGIFVALMWERRTELATMMALGSSRRAVIWHVICEGVLLCFLAAAAGGLLMFALLRGLPLLPIGPAAEILWSATSATDWRVLLFVAGVTVVIAVICSALPAWRTTRLDPIESFRAGSFGAVQAKRLRFAFIAGQVFLAAVLLSAAGMISNLVGAIVVEPAGFSLNRTLFASIEPNDAGHKGEDVEALAKAIITTVGPDAAVESVALARLAPASMYGSALQIDAEASGGAAPPVSLVSYNLVSPNYFTVTGRTILTGRPFSIRDVTGAQPVMIVSRSMAERFWPQRSPIGRTLRVGGDPVPRTIVGVVEDAQERGVRFRPRPYMFFPVVQAPAKARRELTLIIKYRTSAQEAIQSVSHQLAFVAPDLPIFNIRTPTEQIRDAVWRDHLMAMLIRAFGLIALGVAALGLAAVVASNTRQRTREIGIRLSLGATLSSIMAVLLRGAIGPVICGLAMTALVTAGLSPMLRQRFYGGNPETLLVVVVVASILGFITLAAAIIPAARMVQLQPQVALGREE